MKILSDPVQENRVGRSTYYAPFYIGFIIALLARDIYGGSIPPEPVWRHWLAVIGISLGFALACQLSFIGMQGFSAQVLPVPGGRSIRGTGARTTGSALLIGLAGLVVTFMLASETVSTAATISAVLSASLLIVAVIGYLWSLPAAVSDFDSSDPLV